MGPRRASPTAVRTPIQVGDEVVQSRIQTSGQTVGRGRVSWTDIPFHSGASERVAQLIQGAATDFQIARELGVRRAAESFRDVSWSGACRVGQLIAQREVAPKRIPATDANRDLPESIGQLPRDKILKPPDTFHARREEQ